jgi:SAM-dependent methyltransferase
MVSLSSDQQWEKLGQTEPYFGVLSENKFLRENLNEDSYSAFLKTGQEYIGFLLNEIRTCVDRNFTPHRALDFGCGVGRCSIPLARVCTSVVGIDVSKSMLQHATKICAEQNISNLQLIQCDDSLSRVSGQFDLVHSFLVFQHIPRKRGEAIFSKLLDLLSENGVGAVQFVYERQDPVLIRMMGTVRKQIPLFHGLANVMYGKAFSAPLMEKNVYDLNRILAILDRKGCRNVAVRFQGRGKLRGVLVIFQKTPGGVPNSVHGEC